MSAAREPAIALDSIAPEALFTKLRPGPGRPAAEVAENQRARIRRALVEAVVERGYGAVTVREISRLAGVSTRTFYQRYSSKEECLLHTQQLAMRRWIGLADPQSEERDWEGEVSRTIHTLLDEWGRDERAARFALIEACACDSSVRDRVRRLDRTIEAPYGRAFARATARKRMTPLLIAGVAAGVTGVVRARLLADRGDELPLLRSPLTQWALSYPGRVVAELPDLDRVTITRPPRFAGGDDPRNLSGDLPLMLSAVGKVVAAVGFHGVTTRRIIKEAGLQRQAFYAKFTDADDCVIQAFEARAAEVIECAEREAERGASPEGSVYRAMRTLCVHVAADPVFAALCFGDVVSHGRSGAECRERFMAGMRDIVWNTALATESPAERIYIEASIAAVWALIERQVVANRGSRVPRISGTLAYLLMAPIVGGPMAVEAIQDEQTTIARRKSLR